MSDFQDKTEYSLEDIQSLIQNEIEESIHLEYKRSEALGKSESLKKEISKDVSAFANSDGGIIVYGINEIEHKPFAITPIDGNEFSKEWLEQTINSSIQRRISDLHIFAVRIDGNVRETVYVVKIPKSFDAPHMAKDRRFYKRFNFESVIMEEYEVRQSYGQRRRSKLVIAGCRVQATNLNDKDVHTLNFTFEAMVTNIGDIVEERCKVNVYFKNLNPALNMHWPSGDHSTSNSYTRLEDQRIKISSDLKSAIYPDETVTAMRFEIDVPFVNLLEALSSQSFEVILMYPHGEDKQEGSFDNILKMVVEHLEKRFPQSPYLVKE